MRISRQWLSDYVDFDELSEGDFSELITTRVAEVDGVETVGLGLRHGVVGAVLDVKEHPKNKKLKIARVKVGPTEVTVVCGAPNCRAGMLTGYLPPGAKLRIDGEEIEIAEREIAGEKSQGMLVSEKELEVSSDHSGIIDFATKLEPGAKLSSIYGEPDTVIVLDNKSLTHRPDLWSHFGFAREVAAVLGKQLKLSPDIWADNTVEGGRLLHQLSGEGENNFRIKIMPATLCRRFAGVELLGVKVEPSPMWMKRRLFAIGAGIRNLLVDLSNYVMHDIGEPNHAYDADKLDGGEIFVRFAEDGELFTALDGEERRLTKHDVVIADRSHVIGLGGVMGGAQCSVSDSTSRLFLECANFDPVLIRQTAKRHQLRTDASNRFEKNQSPYLVPVGLQRFVEILQRVQSGVSLRGGVADSFPIRQDDVAILTSFDYIRSRLGAELSDKKIGTILSSLSFDIEPTSEGIKVAVPYYRATRDISIADDLVEEVGRIHGYENVPERAPLIESSAPVRKPLKDFENRVRDLLRGQGFSEFYGYSFMNPTEAERLGYPTGTAVTLKNPIDADLTVMRTTLIPSAVGVVERNAKTESSFALFEIGRTFDSQFGAEHEELPLREKFNKQPAFERRLLSLSLVTAGDDGEAFYALTGVIRRLVNLTGQRELKFIPCIDMGSCESATAFNFQRSWMHPYRNAVIESGGRYVGHLAEVRPGVVDKLSNRAVIAEIDLELLLNVDVGVDHFAAFGRFPESFFEMSIVMPERKQYSELDALIRSAAPAGILRSVEVLDVYRGKPLREGEKSISVKLTFGSDERTLSGEELGAIQDGLMNAVNQGEFALRST